MAVHTNGRDKAYDKNARIRLNREARNVFKKHEYAAYRNYAMKQADEVLKVDHNRVSSITNVLFPGRVN